MKEKITFSEACLSSDESDSPYSPIKDGSGDATFAITVAVAPYFPYNGKRFKTYDLEQQKIIIYCVFVNALLETGLDQEPAEHEFEITNRGIAHMHALIYTSKRKEIHKIKCIIASKLAYANNKVERCCWIEETIINKKYWQSYMTKDNYEKSKLFKSKEIPEYNMFLKTEKPSHPSET